MRRGARALPNSLRARLECDQNVQSLLAQIDNVGATGLHPFLRNCPGDAGLAVDNGICVDEHLLTNDPAISAIGDAVSFPRLWSAAAPMRLESVQNALDQARTVAARLTGAPAPYFALPWFWSDQGDLKLQIAGLSGSHDEIVVIGSVEQRQCSVLCFKQDRLIAVESCNRASDHMAARKLLTRGTPLNVSDAREPAFDLKEYESSTRDIAACQ